MSGAGPGGAAKGPGPKGPAPAGEAAASARRPRIGLVIGSGGLKCVASIGLFRALERAAIPVDMAVGCSGGSIYAALFALGWSAERAAEESARLWNRVFTRWDFRSFAQILMPKLLGFDGSFGVVHDEAVNAALAHAFGESTFADARIPLHIVATDLYLGEKVVLSTGRVFDAVRSSIAIPFALRPWRVDGRLLSDGGATDPLPIDVAMREGCDIIVAMGFEEQPAPELPNLLRLVLQTSHTAVNSLLRATYAFHSVAHHAEVLLIAPRFDGPVSLKDSHMIPSLIEQGERAAEREIPYLQRLLAQVGYTGAFAALTPVEEGGSRDAAPPQAAARSGGS